MLDPRIQGNAVLQRTLADKTEIEKHVLSARVLVERLDAALAGREFVSGTRWTLADAFATAAIARFNLHRFDAWWSGGANGNVAAYYARMRARPSFAAATVIEHGAERSL